MNRNSDMTYRPLTQVSELIAAVQLQKRVWGPDSVTSMHQMVAAVHHGGAVIGAYERDALIGFNYSFPGYNGQEAYLASHMMAIDPDYRDRGIGMQLKLEQRRWAMDHGYRKIIWTFDPFEARNGYLNVTKLGGVASRFLPAFYGNGEDGLPIDRFMVEWELDSQRVEQALGGQLAAPADWAAYPRLLEPQLDGTQVVGIRQCSACSAEASRCLVPVPDAASRLRREQPGLFAEWQHRLREHIPAALARGLRVVHLVRTTEPVHYYVLDRV